MLDIIRCCGLVIAIRLLLDLVISLGIICWCTRFFLRGTLILFDTFLAPIWACTPAHYVCERFAFLGPALLLIRIHVDMRTLYPVTANISLAPILLIGSQAGRADSGAAIAHNYRLIYLIRLILRERARRWGLFFILGTIYNRNYDGYSQDDGFENLKYPEVKD